MKGSAVGSSCDARRLEWLDGDLPRPSVAAKLAAAIAAIVAWGAGARIAACAGIILPLFRKSLAGDDDLFAFLNYRRRRGGCWP